jgi:hypothetical protein
MAKSKDGQKEEALNQAEQEYVIFNCKKMTVEEIATNLGHDAEVIRKYVRRNNLKTAEESDIDYEYKAIKASLRLKSWWPSIAKQFVGMKDELKYFEAQWIKLIRQFKEDVTDTEELQIKTLINFEIMANRCMQEKSAHIREITRNEQALEKLYAIDKDDRSDEESAMINALEEKLSILRGATFQFTKEYKDIVGETQKIFKDLKGTRDQRKKQIEDSTANWPNYLKMLQDEESRRREGFDIEAIRLAKNKELNRLSQYHTFGDGTVDRPFLTPESVMRGQDSKENATKQVDNILREEDDIEVDDIVISEDDAEDDDKILWADE